MAMTSCKECGKEISTKAESCPHCGAKPYRPSGLFTTIIIGGAVVMSMGLIASGGGTSPQSKPFDPEQTVRGMCMLQVKSTLHDPGSAEFEHSSSTIVSKNGDVWTVQRPVRAKNAYNATRRVIFQCRYRQIGQEFKLLDIKQL